MAHPYLGESELGEEFSNMRGPLWERGFGEWLS